MVLFCVFLIIHVMIVITTFVIIKKSNINLNYFSIPMLIYWFFLLFAFAGYPLYYLSELSNLSFYDSDNLVIMWKTFFISSIVWLQFFWGMYLIRNKNRCEFDIAYTESRTNLITWILILSLSFLILIQYISKLEDLALFAAFKGEAPWRLAYLRSKMTHEFPRYGWYRVFFRDLLPFLSYVAYANYLFNKQIVWKMAMIFSFIITAFALNMTLEKAPFIIFLGGYVITKYIYQHKYISFHKAIIQYGSVLIVALVFIYTVVMGANDSTEAIQSAVDRIFVGQLRSLYAYIEIFPEKLSYVWGRTFPNIGGLLPWEPYYYTTEIMSMTINNSSIVGSAPTAFFGELWINFGWSFIFLFPVFFGAAIMKIHKYFLKRKLDANLLAYMVWLILHLKDITMSGISVFIVNIPLFFVTLSFILLKKK